MKKNKFVLFLATVTILFIGGCFSNVSASVHKGMPSIIYNQKYRYKGMFGNYFYLSGNSKRILFGGKVMGYKRFNVENYNYIKKYRTYLMSDNTFTSGKADYIAIQKISRKQIYAEIGSYVKSRKKFIPTYEMYMQKY